MLLNKSCRSAGLPGCDYQRYLRRIGALLHFRSNLELLDVQHQAIGVAQVRPVKRVICGITSLVAPLATERVTACDLFRVADPGLVVPPRGMCRRRGRRARRARR